MEIGGVDEYPQSRKVKSRSTQVNGCTLFPRVNWQSDVLYMSTIALTKDVSIELLLCQPPDPSR